MANTVELAANGESTVGRAVRAKGLVRYSSFGKGARGAPYELSQQY